MQNQAAVKSFPMVAAVLGRTFGVRVRIGGTEAYTNGRTICIPALPVDPDEEMLTLARGYLDHEAAHCRFTDFSVLNPRPFEKFLTNVLEDYRVEHRLTEFYPGCGSNFRNLIKHVFVDKAKPAKRGTEIAAYILNTLRSWDCPELVPRVQRFRSVIDRDFPGLLNQLDPLIEEVKTCASTSDCARLATRIANLLQSTANDMGGNAGDSSGSGAGNGDSGDGDSGDGDGGAGDADAGDTDRDSLRKLLFDNSGAGDTAGGDSAGSGDTVSDSLKKLLSGELAAPEDMGERLKKRLDKIFKNSKTAGFTPTAIAMEPHVWYIPENTLANVRSVTVALRSRLSAMLQARTLTHAYPAITGRKLDTRSLYRIGLKDGHVFHKRTEADGLNTAVHILLDASGSMTHRIDMATAACYAIASALYQSGISVGATVFPSGYIDGNNIPAVGTLIPQGGRVTTKIAACAYGTTPLAPALWKILPDIARLPQERKLLLVITDGEPDDEDAARAALADTERACVEVIGVGIDTPIVKTLFRQSINITRIDELPKALFDVLSRRI